jgi:hypothetical protein
LSMTPGRGIEMLMTIRSRFLAGLKSASKIESDLVKGQAKGSWRTKRVSNSFEDWMVWINGERSETDFVVGGYRS